jgi:predicted DNA-binding protein (MmcQ/YjbR family)
MSCGPRAWACARQPRTSRSRAIRTRSAFKIGGKVFGVSSLRQAPLRVSLKCDPDLAVRLRAEHEAIQPGYRLSKRHWNTVSLDGSLPPELVISMIEDSYDLVLASLAAVARAAIGRG